VRDERVGEGLGVGSYEGGDVFEVQAEVLEEEERRPHVVEQPGEVAGVLVQQPLVEPRPELVRGEVEAPLLVFLPSSIPGW